MARQTPQQKRANAAHSRSIEKNMGKPQTQIKKKTTEKSPLSTGMLVLLAFVVAGTMGVGFTEIGGAMLGAFMNMLRSLGLLSK